MMADTIRAVLNDVSEVTKSDVANTDSVITRSLFWTPQRFETFIFRTLRLRPRSSPP